MDRPDLREQVRHGGERFPLGYYTTHSGPCPLTVPHHWHEEVELLRVEQGVCRPSINMEQMEPAARGMLLFINPRDIHALELDPGCQESAVVFGLEGLCFAHCDRAQGALLLPLMRGELRFPARLGQDTPAGRGVLAQMEEIAAAQRRGTAADALLAKAALLKIVALLAGEGLLSRGAGGGGDGDYRLAILRRVLDHIGAHYRERIYIRDLAAVAGMNEQYFCRFFKSCTGKTPTDFINSLRIERAAQRLAGGGDKVLDICLEAGFENMGHFIKKFRQYKGASPSAYRRLRAQDREAATLADGKKSK